MSRITHFLFLSAFSNFALQAMNPGQRQRMEQGISRLNANQVRGVLQERNNNLNQEERSDLVNLLYNLPEQDHELIAQLAGEFGRVSLYRSAIFGCLSLFAHKMTYPKSKKDIKNFFNKITHYVPNSICCIMIAQAARYSSFTIYYYGKKLQYSLSANRYSKVCNIIRNAHVQ